MKNKKSLTFNYLINLVASNLCGLSLIIILLCSSCVIQFEGASARKQKKILLNTYLFKNSEIFYPSATILNIDSFPILSESNISKINYELNDFSKFLFEFACREHSNLESIFGKKLNPPLRLKPIAINNRYPYARSEFNSVFRFDVQVSQSIFRASILKGLVASQNSLWGDVTDFSTINNRDTSEFIILTSFLEKREKIKKSKARGMIKEFSNVFKSDYLEESDPSSWHGMTSVTMQSQSMQYLYTATMLFIFAHETGHRVLGHFDTPLNSKKNCNTLREQEIEADKYATLLMFKIMKVNSFFDFFGNFLLGFEPRYLLGDKLFLDDVYVMAKFNELNSECSYPSSTERSRHIDSIYNSLISKF